MCLIERNKFRKDESMYQQDDNDILHTLNIPDNENELNNLLHTIHTFNDINDYDSFIEQIPGHALIGASNIHTVIIAISLYFYFICLYSIIHNLIM